MFRAIVNNRYAQGVLKLDLKIISQIHNNIRSLTLMKNYDKTYSVTIREGAVYKTETFSDLTKALLHYNWLSELLYSEKE